jgi:2,6-dihydroxypseudooxynicotine hydrolase
MSKIPVNGMGEDTLSYLWTNYMHRFLAEGANYRDLLDLRERIKTMDQWPARWSEMARTYEQRADASLAAGFTHTGGADLTRAALYYFFGQFLLWDNVAAKRTASDNAARTFRRAAAYLDPPQRPVDIPFRNITMPGYLRLPQNMKKPPCVLLLNGLDTTKEEQLVISTLCVQRGLATLMFDGPGQGETFYQMKMWPGYTDAVRAVLDFAEGLTEIDSSRIGVIGRSLGSHYAPRVAAVDDRVKAVVSWGAMYHLHNFRSIPELTRAGFLFVTGSKTVQEAEPYFQSVDLSEFAPKVTCPIMIVNGGLDPITPPENVEMMRAAVKGPTEVLFIADSIHCIHDRAHICRPAMADFMQKHLAG